MRNVPTMKLATRGDRTIEMSREFAATRQMVFDAYTKPELVSQWLGVFNGMTMPVCEIDLRVGGSYRYVWEGHGMKMGMRGVYREISAPARLVATEKFDEAWYPGDAVGTVTFVESVGKTTLMISVEYASKEAREAVLKTPMEHGVAAGFEKLAEVLQGVKS
ncbi:MAG: SRPBCC family protein [Polyangiaceae bacterium]